jgi:hypothetical protein
MLAPEQIMPVPDALTIIYSRAHCRTKAPGGRRIAMKKLIIEFAILMGFAMFMLAGAAAAGQVPVGRPLKIVISRQSTVFPVDIMKNLSEKCPNVTITTNPQSSNYMLYAGGWSGEYRFMVIAKGGDTIFATKTVMLSNAVKDVCKFLNSQP